MGDPHPQVVCGGSVGTRLLSAGLPAYRAPTGACWGVDRWLGDLLATGLRLDGNFLNALVRVRDDLDLREACLAAVRMAPEENCGKAVALGRLLDVPLPAWMEQGAQFREYGGRYGKNRPPDPVSATLPEPAEAHPWPF